MKYCFHPQKISKNKRKGTVGNKIAGKTEKRVQARSSPHLFTPPTITAHICCQLYHGGLLTWKRFVLLPQIHHSPSHKEEFAGQRWEGDGERHSLTPSPRHSSRLFPGLGGINPVKQSMPSSPFLSKLCLLLSDPISAKILKTFMWFPRLHLQYWPQICKMPTLYSCPCFSYFSLSFLCLPFIFKESRGNILL